MSRHSATVLLCTLLVSVSSLSVAQEIDTVGSVSEPESTVPDFRVAEDAEGFRLQMLDLIHELEMSLTEAMQHPRIADALAPRMRTEGLEVPFAPEIYRLIEMAPVEQIEQMRQAVELVPGFFSVPHAVSSAMRQLPPPGEAVDISANRACGNPPPEFDIKVSRTTSLNNLNRAKNALALGAVLAQMLDNITDAATGECELIPIVCIQVPTSWIQTPFSIAKAIFELVNLALDIAINEMDFQINDAEVCISPWVAHGFVDYHNNDPRKTLAGRGCDNRDNDNSDGIDEIDEDMFKPVVTIDASLASKCYRSAQTAQAATNVAVEAADDCVEVTPVIDFAASGLCEATVNATATDQNGNTGESDEVVLTIDGTPPAIMLPDPAACYTDIDAAHAAFAPGAAGVVIDDCTMTEAELTVVEKECVADLRLEAVDECGNKSSKMVSVRVDDTPPEVNIETLLLPSVDGLACFGSDAEAVTTVAEATVFDDNCSSGADLSVGTVIAGPLPEDSTLQGGEFFSMTRSPDGRKPVRERGDSCDILITSTAEDQCGLTTSDSVGVRVDTQPPVLSCSVAEELLWRPDDVMVDVGFVLDLEDNCDGLDTSYEVFVTSDEPTSFNLRVHGEDDAAPDAIVERDANGDVERILLRSQRRQTVADDGRVYRIRVIATDSCGLSSQADCYVVVPKRFAPVPDMGAVVNSGQFFDATEIN